MAKKRTKTATHIIFPNQGPFLWLKQIVSRTSHTQWGAQRVNEKKEVRLTSSPLFPVLRNGKKGITKVYGSMIEKIGIRNMDS